MWNIKDKNSFKSNIKEYEEYFKEDLEAIEEELKKSKQYSDIIDEEIAKLSTPTLGANKGLQHYLIEHITNAVQLQTQRQGLRRDRFAIKKAVVDYASKFADEAELSSVEDIQRAIEDLVKSKKSQNLNSDKINNTDLDDEIDSRLN